MTDSILVRRPLLVALAVLFVFFAGLGAVADLHLGAEWTAGGVQLWAAIWRGDQAATWAVSLYITGGGTVLEWW